MIKTYGLIGFPLGHSFSQKYFTKKFEKENITDCEFKNFAIKNIEEIKTVISSNPTLKGFGVTIPYKEQILTYCSYLSDEVKAIGAANSIKVLDDKLYAYNTDIVGFENSFLELKQQHHKKALILGRGGASKAVQYVLAKNNIDFLIVSRAKSNNTILYNQINETIIKNYAIIINCTPIGTSPNINECPQIPYELLTEKNYLYDLVYNPSNSLFLQNGKEKNALTKNGYDMLVLQAEASWKIWNES